MIVTICGSSAFAKEKVYYRDELNKLGHTAIIHPDYDAFVRGESPDFFADIPAERKRDRIHWYYRSILGSDAILVLNLDKKGIPNYIGGNTLMEIGFAHVHDKYIYLLNPIPEISYADEIRAMYTEMLDGDITRIPLHA